MPAGLLFTEPGPDFDTESVYEEGGGDGAKVAPTTIAALPVSVQGDVPTHPPPFQPPNVEPLEGAAANVTTVPLGYVSTQSVPQLMPAGLLLTVPVPVPLTLTVRASPVEVLPHASFE